METRPPPRSWHQSSAGRSMDSIAEEGTAAMTPPASTGIPFSRRTAGTTLPARSPSKEEVPSASGGSSNDDPDVLPVLVDSRALGSEMSNCVGCIFERYGVVTHDLNGDDVRRPAIHAPGAFTAGVADFRNGLNMVTGDAGDVRAFEGAPQGASLTFRDVSFSLKDHAKEKLILSPVSGHFLPGSMVAVMGPSGCGKTTLLDILANRKTTPWSGDVWLNGCERDELFGRVTAYIPQSGVMPVHWTVREALTFNMALKMPRAGASSNAKEERLLQLFLDLLGLAHVADSKIGSELVRGISGGQRTRVTLGRGLVSGAQILFCDEPTSGLSATDAEHCVKAMRLMAKKWRVTFVVVIHQPRHEVSKLFDHLLLMTSNPGRAVYNGPMSAAPQYWEAVGFPVPAFANPTDFFLDLVSPDIRGEQSARFVEHYCLNVAPRVQEAVAAAVGEPGLRASGLLRGLNDGLAEVWGERLPMRSGRLAAPFHRQVRAVMGRKFALTCRDKEALVADFAMKVVTGGIMGAAFHGIESSGMPMELSRVLGLWFLMMVCVTSERRDVIDRMMLDRTIMKFETADALYSEWVFILSVSSVDMAIGFLGNTLFIATLFFCSGLDLVFFRSVFIWMTLAWASFGSVIDMVAAIASNGDTARSFSIPILAVMGMWNGFTTSKESAPAWSRWILWTNPVAYSMEAMAWDAARMYDEGSLQRAYWDVVIESNGYEDAPVRAVQVMLSVCLVFRFVQALALKHLNKIKK